MKLTQEVMKIELSLSLFSCVMVMDDERTSVYQVKRQASV